MGSIINFPNSHETNMDEAKHVRGTLVSKVQLADQVYEVVIGLGTEAQAPRFAAGQFAIISVAPGVEREYSIASLPNNPASLTLCVGTKPNGPGSKFFVGLNVGDPVDLALPYGVFTVKPTKKPILFVATGSGVAPFKSMVPDLLASGFAEDVRLLFGVRSEPDLFYRNFFESLAERYINFAFTPTLSQASDSWEGIRGRVTAHLEEHGGEYLNHDVYICGSKPMIMDVRKLLISKGVPALSMKFEVFG